MRDVPGLGMTVAWMMDMVPYSLCSRGTGRNNPGWNSVDSKGKSPQNGRDNRGLRIGMPFKNNDLPLSIRWRIRPRRFVRALLLVSFFLFLAGLAGQIIRFTTGDGHVYGFVPKFNLDAEMNVPTWFSSALLALCGLLTLRVAARENAPGWRRKWRFLAGAFFICSIDEIAAMHEMLVDPVRSLLHTRGLLHFAWVVPGILLVAFLAVFLAPLFLRLPPSVKRTFFFAAAVFLGGAIGLEMAGGAYVAVHGPDHFAYSLLAHIEELLELLGPILFVKGAMQLLYAPAGQ